MRVVVAARYLAGDPHGKTWLSRLGWDHPGRASTIELGPLDFTGTADTLFHMGIPLDTLSQRVDIVFELHRLSVGDPLLVNLYIEDLWARGQDVSRLGS